MEIDMSNLYREVVETVTNELQAAGIEFDVDKSQKHIKFRWMAGQVNRMYVTSISPSDFRAPMNAKHEVRRPPRAICAPVRPAPQQEDRD
jgi:hypothetical protein